MVESQTEDRQARRALQVLVVDDNRDAADSLALLLKAWGYDFRVAYDGHAGLEAACTYHPDCLFLDVGLPGMDGCTLARRIREQPDLARARLVALTAYSDEATRRRTREAGFDQYLVKPADPSELQRILTMLDEVVRLASQTEELARQNVALATETRGLLQEVKEDIREVKDELKELKQELREVKEERKGENEVSPG